MINYGTTCSAGCVRLTVADAYWIYSNIPQGTLVEFYSSDNSGPFGKPETQKISNNETCRNWDPTDNNPNNPWNTYVEESSTENNNISESNNSDNKSNTPTKDIDIYNEIIVSDENYI